MTRTQNQGKAAFPPNENNIGGMHQILNDFKHMQSRLQVAGPTVGQLVRYKDAPPQLSMAQRLSINRARRRGAVDLTAVSHINRVYHMHR